ncbi:reverse transcriptase domain-containing protein [Tanacetum coccineum]
MLLSKSNMSTKPAHNMSFDAEKTQLEVFPNILNNAKLHMSSEPTQPKTELYLDEITDGASRTIIVMICRIWDVHTITGRYVSTYFVMSDAKGNTFYSTAKANAAHNFLRLKEGSIYCIKNFVVQTNKEEYRIFKDHAYMIEFDGATSVRKTSVKSGGFVRYPFQLKELGSIELTDNKYLIGIPYLAYVAGYVTNLGRITQQKSGSRTIDFFIANGSRQAIQVTLWGGLGDALVEKKTNNVGLYPVVLASMNVKLYSNKLYLSSGSSTQILDDPQIPALRALRAENSQCEVSLSQAAVHVDYSQAKEGTLESLLIWAQNRKNDVRVKVDDIGTRKGWNFPSCGGEICKKGVVRKEGSFWCEACNKAVEYPVLRFRLELDVSDKNASTVVVMFDESATELVKCSADSLAEADDDSFTCWRIAPEEVVEEDAGSSNVGASVEVNIKELKRLATKPSVATPLKPVEERGKRVDLEDLDEEVTCGIDDGLADAKDSYVSDKRKKKRYIVDDSASEWEGRPPLRNNTNAGEKRKATASTSRHPLNTSKLSRSEHPRTRVTRKIPKRAALTFAEEWKCKTASHIDDIISAEIPSPTTDPEGYKVVNEYMLHDPCGKGATCTVDGKCSKMFPKPFYSETMLDKDGKRKLFKYPDLQLIDEQIKNYCLLEIETLLNRNERSFTDFQELPRPNQTLLTYMDNRLIREALDFDIKKSKIDREQLHSLLNPEQRVIYEHVIEFVHNQNGQFYFVYGPGGTGKTFLYQTIISRLRSERMIVLAILPVIPKGKRAEIVQVCINHSELWKSSKVFMLTRSMRVNEYSINGEIDNRKRQFNEWVLDVGDETVEAKKRKTRMMLPGLIF